MKKIKSTKQTVKEVKIALGYANSIIATLREPFLVINKNLRVVSANHSFYTTFKVGEKETVGRLLPDLDSRQWNIHKLIHLLKEILPEKTVLTNYEVEHEFKTIGHRVMNLNALQLRIPKKIARLITGGEEEEEEELILLAIEDITERERLRKELKGSEERYRRAFETSRDGLLLIHKTEGDILNSNESIQKLLDYSQEEFLKKKLWEIGVTKDVADFQEMMSRLERDGVVHYEDTLVKTKKGLRIDTEVFLVDRAKVLQCNIRDITHERDVERTKSEFISLTSHQLKNPPTAIKLLTERIVKGRVGTLTEKQREYFDDIRSTNQSMITLINALLNVSRIELGGFTIQVKKEGACAIVQSILDELKSAIDKKQLKLKTIFPEKNVLLMLDEPLFHIVIYNLVMNAINYTARGTIQVECKEVNKGQTMGGKALKENSFVVVVSDTGYGIPKHQQSKLFTKFFRADNIRDKHTDGTGLGLYITKSILDNSGGSIWFTSEEGKGAAFYVAIPLTGMRPRVGTKELTLS